MIRTKQLTKDYGGGRGVLDLDLEIPEKRVFGFIGPNGSGKTTTIKLLCGLVRPDKGEAWIDDIPVSPRNHVKIKRIVGYLPDEFGVYQQMTVWEYLDFFGAAYRIPPKQRRKRIDEVLDVTDASHMADYLVSSLSRGMHQKVGIAKTLLHDPKLLILDEPANGLDPYARIEMRETILRLQSMGKTLMVSSHILPELGSICDVVGIIEKGRLLTQGTVREITSSLRQNIILELELASNPEAAAEAVKELGTVQDVSFSGDAMRIDFVGKREQIADLNQHLVEHNVKVVGFREAEVDLEQVFLSVTGKKDGRDLGTAAKPGKDAARKEEAPSLEIPKSADPELNAAMDKARDRVGKFVKNFVAQQPEQSHFAVKKLYVDGDTEDLLWLVDLEFDGVEFKGKLRNGSKLLDGLNKDDPAHVSVEALADWMFIEDGELVGGYTIRMKFDQLDDAKKRRFLSNKPYTISK